MKSQSAAAACQTVSALEAPTGVVTIMFTDIEGSTRLWETYPELMRTALERHDELVRTAVAGAQGFVFKTVGDGFRVAFRDPVAAVALTPKPTQDRFVSSAADTPAAAKPTKTAEAMAPTGGAAVTAPASPAR